MNLHHPCTSCQNENCECMELQLQLQGNIYKPLEGLKLIAGISLMLIILITLKVLGKKHLWKLLQMADINSQPEWSVR